MSFTSLSNAQKQNNNRGFTLIELLVVIAIIGILATVVLASLSGARTRAKDTAVQAMVSQIRNEAEIYYSNNLTYGSGDDSFCADIVETLQDAIEERGGDGVAYNCTADGESYTAQATLSTEEVFCVDATGYSGVSEGVTAGESCR